MNFFEVRNKFHQYLQNKGQTPPDTQRYKEARVLYTRNKRPIIRKGGYMPLGSSLFYIHRCRTIEAGWLINVAIEIQLDGHKNTSYLQHVWNTKIEPEVLRKAAKDIQTMEALLEKHHCPAQVKTLAAENLIDAIKRGLYSNPISISLFGTKKTMACPLCGAPGVITYWDKTNTEEEEEEETK